MRYLKVSSFVLFVLLSFLFGMVSYRENLFPRKMLHEFNQFLKSASDDDTTNEESGLSKKSGIVKIKPYSRGMPLFSDRSYFDTVGSPELESSFVVQIPRHHDDHITVKIYKPVTIFRLLSKFNDNDPFSDWDSTDIKVNVVAKSCNHSYVVSKEFESGTVELPSGGPVSSSPIIIRGKEPIIPPISLLRN